MMDELSTIVLNHDIPKYNLKEGDLGTVVHSYGDKQAMEVEFVTAEGKTVAVLTLTPKDVRPLAKKEILHVRSFASA